MTWFGSGRTTNCKWSQQVYYGWWQRWWWVRFQVQPYRKWRMKRFTWSTVFKSSHSYHSALLLSKHSKACHKSNAIQIDGMFHEYRTRTHIHRLYLHLIAIYFQLIVVTARYRSYELKPFCFFLLHLPLCLCDAVLNVIFVVARFLLIFCFLSMARPHFSISSHSNWTLKWLFWFGYNISVSQ